MKTPCIEWRGCRIPKGYGMFTKDGVTQYAHRAALEEKLGRPIKKGMECLHSCDNPPCINLDHLTEGTRGDNMKDMHCKGRAQGKQLAPPGIYSPGETNPMAKLFDDEAEEIRRLYKAGQYLQRELALLFGVSQPTISNIITGTTRS